MRSFLDLRLGLRLGLAVAAVVMTAAALLGGRRSVDSAAFPMAVVPDLHDVAITFILRTGLGWRAWSPMARFQILTCLLMLVALFAPVLSATMVPAEDAGAAQTVMFEAVGGPSLGAGCGLDCPPFPLSVLRQGLATAIPAHDADGDGLDDFWLVHYGATPARESSIALLHSSATGDALREVSAAGAIMFPVMTQGADPHLRTLTGIGNGPAISLFWVYHTPATDIECDVLPYPYYSVRLVVVQRVPIRV
jgi:hypothetical protein